MISDALHHINATRGLSVVPSDLTDAYPISASPSRFGDYLAAASEQAETWHAAHFDGAWSAVGVRIGTGWVWRGLLAPAQPAPPFDLSEWAEHTLTDMREKTIRALLGMRADGARSQSGSQGDEVDQSSARIEHETRLRASGVLSERLREIEAAINRLRGGEYGICQKTGEEIALPRLKANPLARYTLEVQQRLEDGKRIFGRSAA